MYGFILALLPANLTPETIQRKHFLLLDNKLNFTVLKNTCAFLRPTEKINRSAEGVSKMLLFRKLVINSFYMILVSRFPKVRVPAISTSYWVPRLLRIPRSGVPFIFHGPIGRSQTVPNFPDVESEGTRTPSQRRGSKSMLKLQNAALW